MGKSRLTLISVACFGAWGCSQPYNITQMAPPKVAALATCSPVVGKVDPVEARDLRWKWADGSYPTYNQNMSTPMVADINGDQVGDFVFTSFTNGSYNAAGVLRVVSGKDGREIWSSGTVGAQPFGAAAPAIYDLNRDGKPEILAVGPGANLPGPSQPPVTLVVLGSNGGLIRTFPLARTIGFHARVSVGPGPTAGIYDVVVGIGAVADLYRYDFAQQTLSGPLMDQVLGIMDQKIFTTTAVYSQDLSKLFDIELPPLGAYSVAFGNFDSTPDTDFAILSASVDSTVKPAIIRPLTATTYNGSTGKKLSSWTMPQSFTDACSARNPNAKTVSKSGGANVGDLDGDGFADLTFAGGCNFWALKNTPAKGLELLWQVQTRDFSSSVTGSSVFDFNGDGRVEAVYNDEVYFRIIDGMSGTTLYSLRNDNGTLWENPVVVSLRAGEPASIILSANSYTSITQKDDPGALEDVETGLVNVTGIRVIQGGSNLWMPTREIWNQFDYTITNVTDNLQVPPKALDFVSVSNRMRANIPVINIPCR